MTVNVRDFVIEKLKNDPAASLNISFRDATLWDKTVSSATICKECSHMLEFAQTSNSATYPIVVSKYDPETKVAYAIELGTVTIRKTRDGSLQKSVGPVHSRMEYYVCTENEHCEVYDARTGLSYIRNADGKIVEVGKETSQNVAEIQDVFSKKF